MLGIWSSAITGFVVACVGGGPGVIAGAAGVVALPLAGIVKVCPVKSNVAQSNHTSLSHIPSQISLKSPRSLDTGSRH